MFLILIILLVVLSLIVLYQLICFLAAILLPDPVFHVAEYKKFAIIVPAHNEELIISILLNSLKNLDYPEDKFEPIIIADNCTDKTASIVRKSGYRVLERFDAEKRGKGYALGWTFEKIKLENHDVYVVIDADTKIDSHFLKNINKYFNNSNDIVQGWYGTIAEPDNFISQMMYVSDILQFNYYYNGKNKLGFSCRLVGNGMCFSKEIIHTLGWDAYTITENNEYTIKLALTGYRIAFAKNAVIETQQVKSLDEGKNQRTRWMAGRKSLLIKYLPSMLVNSIKDKNLKLLETAIELLVPSISMQIVFLTLVIPVLIIYNNSFFYIWFLLLLVFYIIYFSIALKKANLGLKFIPQAIIYLFWKTILKTKIIVQKESNRWVKTSRH